jgi:MoaA/NifB/PqqE/SkfB family radical SAM enzyme
MNKKLEQVHTIAISTGSYGRKGCTAKCPGCFLGKYGSLKPMYQGNLQQIYELLKLLPNLNKVGIFGNPDVSVDTQFCNEVAHVLQENKKLLCFCSAGIGGAKTLEKLLDGIKAESIDRFLFHIDSLDDDMISKLMGIKMSLKTILEGIEFCNDKGIKFSVSITLWPENADEDLLAFKKYFDKYKPTKISVHFGHIEGSEGRMQHLSEDRVYELRTKYQRELRMPWCLVTEEEYNTNISTWKSHPEITCTNDACRLLVILEEDGIKASPCCPMLVNVYPELIVPIRKINLPLSYKGLPVCPVSDHVFGYTPKRLKPICRFIKTEIY